MPSWAHTIMSVIPAQPLWGLLLVPPLGVKKGWGRIGRRYVASKESKELLWGWLLLVEPYLFLDLFKGKQTKAQATAKSTTS